jgi:hypothetical protein
MMRPALLVAERALLQ